LPVSQVARSCRHCALRQADAMAESMRRDGRKNSSKALNFRSNMSTNPGLDFDETNGDDMPPDAPSGLTPQAPSGPSSRRPQPGRRQEKTIDVLCSSTEAILEEMQLSRDELKFGKMVGSGITAEVFKGSWLGQSVAIKVLKVSGRKTAQLKQEVAFLRETAVAAQVSHKNLVQLHGLVFDAQPYLLVTEFCFGGTAFNLLHDSGLELAMWQKLKMTCDVACAMEYLHKFRPQIIHRDLKSLNLLMASTVENQCDVPHVKVSDFGLAKMKDDADWGKMTVEAGTFHWMAPEVATGRYDEKADIYSFAMVLFEIICQEIPFEELEPNEVLPHAMDGNRPDLEAIPPGCPKEISTLMEKSWNHTPQERPSFTDICMTLDRLVRNFSCS